MAAERIIGVDVGTSTSVIRVKRYQDGKPVGDRLEVKPVKFNSGTSEIVPTLIEKLPSGAPYFGYEAESGHRNAKTFQNFKVNIENPDEDIRRQARELTVEFFQYLADEYRAQSEGGHLGEIDDRQRTIISYPVKWSDEAKAFLVQTAKDAGFPNVEGVDEARAAIQAVTVQSANLLTRKGYFQDGVPVNILLIDMGAGTTDLVLCRHTPGAEPKTDILGTWPKGGNVLFGGREVDKLLRSYISQAMPEDGADIALEKVEIEKYKAWKENTVSPALEKGESVDYFYALDVLLNVINIKAEYSIDRDSFETYAADYLRQFPELVNGCVSAAGLSGNDVDLVILTGGHSQWYFVREMLSGKLERFGKIGLGKVQADPKRIVPITLPHETVALGLAYMPLKKDGTVIVLGRNYSDSHYAYDASWQDVVAIAYGRNHTVGLKKDGTVIADGSNIYGQCNVDNWRDIVAIAAGAGHTVGLTHDGTVIEVGDVTDGEFDRPLPNYDVLDGSILNGIVFSLALSGRMMGRLTYEAHAKGLNGPKPFSVHGQFNIVAIAAGMFHTVCLKRDGTVIAVGENEDGQCNVSSWQDIVAIAAGNYHTVGLKRDGTVIAVGENNYGQCNVNSWRNIVAIAAGAWHTVGLRHDGTVIEVGFDDYASPYNDVYNSVDVFEYTMWDGKHMSLGFLSETLKIKKL